jgi:DmsE family decaheme c-type cytochrome
VTHQEHAASLRNSRIIVRVLALPWLLAALTFQLLQPATAQDAQFTADGTASCIRCHGGESMTVMAETPHGDSDDPHTPYAQQGCESCHGPGSIHISRARGGRGFPELLRFGDSETTAQQSASCLNCHTNDMGALAGIDWTDSLHDTGRMTCVSCHQLHTTDNPMADEAQQTNTCAHCHEKQIAGHPRFEDKGIVFDQLTCYDCHDVHQLLHDQPE